MKITLKERKLKSGKISLSIEYYKGSEISLEGKRRHIREIENLKMFLYDEPKNTIERKNKTVAKPKSISIYISTLRF